MKQIMEDTNRVYNLNIADVDIDIKIDADVNQIKQTT